MSDSIILEPETVPVPHLRAKMVARAALAYHALHRLTAQNTQITGKNAYIIPTEHTRDLSLRCAVGAALTKAQAFKAEACKWYDVRTQVRDGYMTVASDEALTAISRLQSLHDEWAGANLKTPTTLTPADQAERVFLDYARELAEITTLDPAKLARAALDAHRERRLCALQTLARQNRKSRGLASSYYVDMLYPYNGLGCAIGVGLDQDDKVTAENRPAGLGYNISELIDAGLFKVAKPEDATAISRLQRAHDEWSSQADSAKHDTSKAKEAERAFLAQADAMIPLFVEVTPSE